MKKVLSFLFAVLLAFAIVTLANAQVWYNLSHFDCNEIGFGVALAEAPVWYTQSESVQVIANVTKLGSTYTRGITLSKFNVEEGQDWFMTWEPWFDQERDGWGTYYVREIVIVDGEREPHTLYIPYHTRHTCGTPRRTYMPLLFR